MTRRLRVGFSEEGADLIGSPQYIRKRLAAHQARGLSQSGTHRSATQPESALSGVAVFDVEQTTPAKTSSPRSPRSLWADKWQR